MKRTLKVFGLLLLVALALAASGMSWFAFSSPSLQRRQLANDLIGVDSPAGQEVLRAAAFKTDLSQLTPEFVAQSRRAFCGVASSVTVINAITHAEPRLTEESLFTDKARAVRGPLAVSFGGLTLDQLAKIVEAHGVSVRPVHAAQSSEASFREAVRSALSEPQEFVVINYDRRVLEQEGAGHISPLAAYNAEQDSVLVLDVAAHKYPYTWVPLAKLWRAIDTTDSDSGLTRGYLLLRAR